MLGIKAILTIFVCLLGLGINHEHNVLAHALSFHTSHPKKYHVLTAVRKKGWTVELAKITLFSE